LGKSRTFWAESQFAQKVGLIIDFLGKALYLGFAQKPPLRTQSIWVFVQVAILHKKSLL